MGWWRGAWNRRGAVGWAGGEEGAVGLLLLHNHMDMWEGGWGGADTNGSGWAAGKGAIAHCILFVNNEYLKSLLRTLVGGK